MAQPSAFDDQGIGDAVPRAARWAVAHIRQRPGPLGAVAAGLGLAVILYLNPFQVFWVNIYEGLHMYQWWPLLSLPVGLWFTYAGVFRWRRTGMPQYFPWCALSAGLILLVVAMWGLLTTGMDWSTVWSICVGILLASGVLVFLLGFLGYTELWRVVCNSAVIGTVRRALQDGSFRIRAEREVEKQRWGSEHCLRVVQGEYDTKKVFALAEMLSLASGSGSAGGGKQAVAPAPDSGSADERREVDPCLKAGEDLRQYLSVRWPEELVRPAELEWRRLEVARHLLTLSLDEGYGQYSDQIDRWMSELDAWLQGTMQANGLYGTESRLYVEFLRGVFALGQGLSGRVEPVAAGQTVREFYTKFGELPDHIAVPHDNGTTVLAARTICAHTWLALADRSLRRQAAFDGWMAMCSTNDADLMVPTPAPGEPEALEPSQIAALCRLTYWYRQWRADTHSEWNEGLAGRARHVSNTYK